MISGSDIKIKIKLLESDTLLAQATVIVQDVMEIHGWKILASKHIHEKFQEQLWIQAPSYKAGARWKEIVFISDRPLYNLVQEKIYDAYRLEKAKQEKRDDLPDLIQQEENVNPDDIPL